MTQIDVDVAPLTQDEGVHGQVPRMLGCVLPAMTSDDRGLTLDLLQTIDLQKEIELALESFPFHQSNLNSRRGWPKPRLQR